MKCPKCGYLGFEKTERCRNCGYEFSLAAEPPRAADVALRPADEGPPAADLSLGVRPSEPAVEETRAPAKLDLDRLIGVPTPSVDLPLFNEAPGDDSPLLSTSSPPRAPLAVRRATPETQRFRTRPAPADLSEPEFSFETSPPHEVTRPAPTPAPVPRGEPIADAGTGRRLGAATIDAAMLAAIDAAVLHFTLRLCDLTTADLRMLPLAPLAGFFFVLNGGYVMAFTAIGGQTIGKMLFGLRVLGEDDRPVGPAPAAMRTLGVLGTVLTLGVGFLPALGSGKRAMHDRLARTHVVHEPLPTAAHLS